MTEPKPGVSETVTARADKRARPTWPERVIVGHGWIRSGVTSKTAYTTPAEREIAPGAGPEWRWHTGFVE